MASGVEVERQAAAGRIAAASGVGSERALAGRRIVRAGGVRTERFGANRRVAAAGVVLETEAEGERPVADGGVPAAEVRQERPSADAGVEVPRTEFQGPQAERSVGRARAQCEGTGAARGVFIRVTLCRVTPGSDTGRLAPTRSDVHQHDEASNHRDEASEWLHEASMRRMIPARYEETAGNIDHGSYRPSSPLSIRACRSSHSAPIRPSGWLAWRSTLTASSIVLMRPASMALMSVK